MFTVKTQYLCYDHNMSRTLNKTFFESKVLAIFYGSIVFIPLVLAVSVEFLQSGTDQVYIKTLVWSLGVFLTCFALFIKFYPVAFLEIYNDRFVYKKGRKVINAKWNEVVLIAFQNRSKGIPRSFIIRVGDRSTDLISTNILKLKNQKDYKLNLVDFVTELESVSGQKIKWGDVSVNKFSEAGFLDFIKS